MSEEQHLSPEQLAAMDVAASQPDASLAKEIQSKCQDEFNKRSSMLSDTFNVSFDKQMHNMTDRYSSHAHDRVIVKQTDVLRANKVFREVSREMGADWRPVFERLMREEPEDKTKVCMARIEREKPFMQAFKSLNLWREALGDRFELRPLVEALMFVDRRDLAEKVLDTLDNNEIDSLYAHDSIGKGIAGGAPKRQSAKPQEGQEGDTPVERKPAPPVATKEDPIADRALLKVAKAFDKDWEPLAKALELPAEEIEETKEHSANSYHGGFKCLFSWRDNMIESGKNTDESAATLRDILTKLGKKDLADSLGR